MTTTRIKTLGYICIAATLLLSGCFKEDVNEALGTNNPEISIYALRNTFKGQEMILEANTLTNANHIRGLVVSNHAGKNIPSNCIAIQNEWRGQLRGIMLEVNDVDRYRLGDSIDVWIDGLKLAQKNGILTLSGLNHNNTYIINRNNPVKATPVSIASLSNKYDDYESTYVEVTSDLVEDPAPDAQIRGSRPVADDKENRVYITVTEQATFGNESITPSATFRGLVLKENDKVQLRLLTYADMLYPSGKLYAGWPESFEAPDRPKGSYNMPDIGNNVIFQTGEWHLNQSIIGNTVGRDRIVSGINAIRIQQNQAGLLQMNFDLPDGAAKVTFWYGSYYDDPTSWFVLEYSTDQGATWKQAGEKVTDAHKNAESLQAKQAIFMLDIEGPVRFRLNRPLANNAGGRLGIDDFAIFKNF